MKDEKKLTREEDIALASKSWTPYLIMVIVGTVIFVIGAILVEAAGLIAGGIEAGVTELREFEYLVVPFAISGLVTCIVSLGLLGPGVPLMIITIVKKAKASKRLNAKK